MSDQFDENVAVQMPEAKEHPETPWSIESESSFLDVIRHLDSGLNSTLKFRDALESDLKLVGESLEKVKQVQKRLETIYEALTLIEDIVKDKMNPLP